MTRTIPALSLLALSATTALAHPGHIVARAGHDHLPFLAALALVALLLGGVGATLLRGRAGRRGQKTRA